MSVEPRQLGSSIAGPEPPRTDNPIDISVPAQAGGNTATVRKLSMAVRWLAAIAIAGILLLAWGLT